MIGRKLRSVDWQVVLKQKGVKQADIKQGLSVLISIHFNNLFVYTPKFPIVWFLTALYFLRLENGVLRRRYTLFASVL
jgi:hypothetical protein